MFNDFARTGMLLLTVLMTSCFLSCRDVEKFGTNGNLMRVKLRLKRC